MAIGLAIPGSATGQVITAPPPQAADLVQELRTIERKWVSALARSDSKALADILDDTFMDTNEEGKQTDKKEILEAVKSGDLKVSGTQLSQLRIHSFVYAAVITGKAQQTGTWKGEKLPPSVSFTHTFVMINGVWKMVASHRSALPPSDQSNK